MKPKRIESPLTPTGAVARLEEVLNSIFPEGVWDDSAHRTAERLYAYLTEYAPRQEMPFTFTTFPAEVNQIIAIRDIEYASICKHHLLPFFGTCDIGYIPNQVMAGASKLPRLVDFWALRPQTQELLSEMIAADLKERLACQGVAVVMRASHTCIGCRGVRKVGASMVTSVMKGVFLTNPAARQEFFELVRLK